jgi:hypothetical protein
LSDTGGWRIQCFVFPHHVRECVDDLASIFS